MAGRRRVWPLEQKLALIAEMVLEQAPAPTRIVEGGMPSEALIAHVLVAKCADHQAVQLLRQRRQK